MCADKEAAHLRALPWSGATVGVNQPATDSRKRATGYNQGRNRSHKFSADTIDETRTMISTVIGDLRSESAQRIVEVSKQYVHVIYI